MTDQQLLQEKQANRYRALRKLYEETKGSPWAIVGFFEVAARAGLDEQAAEDAFAFLSGENLLKPMTFGGGVSITHNGVKEVESSIADPKRSTRHFSNLVINIHGNVGGVQTGDHNQLTASQVDETSDELTSLLKEVKATASRLSMEQRREVEDLVSAMQEELKKRPARKSIIRALADSLKNLLLPAGSAVLARLIEKLSAL